jgi:hypothetical protein
MSVMIGTFRASAAREAATGSWQNRISSAMEKSPTATEHRCRIRSSGVAFPITDLASTRDFIEISYASRVFAPRSV